MCTCGGPAGVEGKPALPESWCGHTPGAVQSCLEPRKAQQAEEFRVFEGETSNRFVSQGVFAEASC